MASMPMAARQPTFEMYQKGAVRPIFVTKMAGSRPLSEATEMDDTDFEEDFSDSEEYSGRRSEESFGKQSDTSISTFDELRTPNSNEFAGFNFQLPDKPPPSKPVEGPVGPHLFRISQDATQDVDFYLSMSPASSPQDYRAGPTARTNIRYRQDVEEAPLSSIPLQAWTPRQVSDWMVGFGFEDSIVEKFRMHDISGAILKDLQFEDLKELGIKSFGQRHHLWNEIRTLRGNGLSSIPSTPADEACTSPKVAQQVAIRNVRANECSNPATPEDDHARSPVTGRRRARRARRPDDIISPGESASIVAIEQLLPKPHHCSKGENCSKWQKQQRKLAKIAKEFPLELEQLGDTASSPTEIAARPTSEAVPSVVASSDVLGPARLPTLRLDEDVLRVVQARDPQENVRQFLTFQHMGVPVEEPTTPPYEMFPPLSPPANTQAPNRNLGMLPKLTIPAAAPQDAFSPNRTVTRQQRTPITAMEIKDRNAPYDLFRMGSPASDMDVPLTAIPLGPVARDESQSVPPDMRFGGGAPISRSSSRLGHRPQPFSPISRPQTATPIERSASCASRRRQPSFAMAPVQEHARDTLSPIDGTDELTPTSKNIHDANHAGWMKKRRTKMLRHEWQESHVRLHGTRLAMHRNSRVLDALESIDVDEYAVACSSLASNTKLGAAFKSLKLSGKKKEGDPAAFTFQLVPAAEKRGILNAATGKTHHFAVKSRDERIDWMRELMLAKALRQKGEGCEINVNGNQF